MVGRTRGWLERSFAGAALVLATLLSASPIPAQPTATPGGRQPRIEVTDPVFDFGSMNEGTPVKHAFAISNTGNADLIIGLVQTSCGCTVAQPAKKKLAPGESTELAATLDTRHEHGHVSRRIDVYTNDPRAQDTALTMRGTVTLETEADPPEVNFQDVRQGTEKTLEVTIKYLGQDKNFRIDKLSNSNPNVKVVPQGAASGSSRVLKLTLLKTAAMGPFTDTVVVATNHRPVEIHIYGRVTGDLVIEPAQVSFGIVPHGQGALRIARLVNKGGGPVRVENATSSTAAVAVQVDPVEAGREYKITIQIRKGTADGQVRGQVVVKTDDPRQSEVTIPFYGIVGSFKG